MTTYHVRLQCSPRAQAGYILLEWLIAAALGLLVLGGAMTLYRAQRESFSRAADAARMREAAVTALTLVGQHIQMAGYAPPDQPALRARIVPAVFGCEAARPVLSGAHDEPGCMPHRADVADSDGLVVRYLDDAVATWRGASGEPTDCLGQGVERLGQHALIVNRFFVARPARREEPELYCSGNGHTRTPQPIVEGVERVWLRYWLRGATEPVPARALAPTRWDDVVAVDLCVVVRGRRAMAGAAFVDCQGKRVSSSDGRARLSLSRHLVLRNRAAAP